MHKYFNLVRFIAGRDDQGARKVELEGTPVSKFIPFERMKVEFLAGEVAIIVLYEVDEDELARRL